jgi:hypothetical protein
MTRELFEKRLVALTPRDEEKTTSLVEDYRKDVTDVQATALRYLRAGGAQAGRALSVIAQFEETAVELLAATIATEKAAPDPSLLKALADGLVFAETAVVRRLQDALTDTRLVPRPPELRFMEEVPPAYRVCDEAYTALRRLLNPESLRQCLMESRHFLSLPEAEKNREIELWHRTGSFNRFLDDIDIEEE